MTVMNQFGEPLVVRDATIDIPRINDIATTKYMYVLLLIYYLEVYFRFRICLMLIPKTLVDIKIASIA